MTGQVTEDTNTKVTPELKKKTSSQMQNTSKVNAIIQNTGEYEVNKGTGQNGKTLEMIVKGIKYTYFSEEFNGVKHIYAGFNPGDPSTSDVINGAIMLAAAGDRVLVKGGTYTGTIRIESGVKLLGGYKEDGSRDYSAAKTTINGNVDMTRTVSAELNGFTIHSPRGGFIVNVGWSDKSTVANNYIDGGGYGVYISYGSNHLIKNNIIYSGTHGVWLTTTGNSKVIGNEIHAVQDSVVPCGTGFTSIGNNFYFGANHMGGGGGVPIYSTGDYFSRSIAGTANVNLSDVRATPNAIDLAQPKTSSGIKQTSISFTTTPIYINFYNKQWYTEYGSDISNSAFVSNSSSTGNISAIFKGLMANKSDLLLDGLGAYNEALVGGVVNNTLTFTLAVPGVEATENKARDMQVALALADIIKNPTKGQKLVLDAAQGLLEDMKNIEDQVGVDPELSKAESDLLQVAANVLLAQGVPDLLKSEDINSIRGIFKDLGQSKDKIILDYNRSAAPYYSNIVKKLEANMSALQLKGILSKELTKEDLKQFTPKEIEKIVKSIREANDKNFEMEYILQQDVKYRKAYLDPANKLLEESMKKMMHSFTGKLNNALEKKR
jgi:parallel beta-helix repeat protein